jgi:hypothetical protein
MEVAPMPDILVRDVDPIVAENLKLAAKQRGVSVSRLAAETLTERFAGGALPRYHDLDALAGTWSAEDLREFEEAIEPLTKIDEQLWTKQRRKKK